MTKIKFIAPSTIYIGNQIVSQYDIVDIPNEKAWQLIEQKYAVEVKEEKKEAPAKKDK